MDASDLIIKRDHPLSSPDESVCPICQGAMVYWLSMPIDPKTCKPCKHGTAFRCQRCQFGMILPRPSAQETAAFYQLDNYYTHGKSHFAVGGPRTFWDRLRVHLAWKMDYGAEINAQAIDGLLHHRAAAICDIGCGDGSLIARLAELGHAAVGVEFDSRSAAEAVKSGIKVYEGSIDDLPQEVRGRQFDMVIMSHVLEHVPNPVEAVKSVNNILRPGGLFVIILPNNASLGLRESGLSWEPLDIPRHLNFFTPRSLRQIVCQAGFEEIKLFFNGFSRYFHDRWIRTEQRIWDDIVKETGKPPTIGKRNSSVQAWILLIRTIFTSKEKKYDSVGIVAKKL